MKFDTKALLAATDKALTASYARHVQRVNEYRDAEAERMAEWRKSEAPRWEDAAQNILAVLDDDGVVTREMLPRNRHGWDPAWYDARRGSMEKPPTEFVAPRELTSMKATLQMITDPEVTPSGLRALGFTSAMLQTVISWMGK